MRDLTPYLASTVLLLSFCGTACSGGAKSKELTALDSAYKTGILTTDEYEAKKAALTTESDTLAALDKAFAAGVLTKDEYDARRNRLNATIVSLAAIEKAHRAGVLTNDEYRAKKSALLASTEPLPPVPAATTAVAAQAASSAASSPATSSNPPPAAAPSTSDGHTYQMKLVKIMDAQGWEKPMVSATMLIPLDWQSQGATTWNIKDSCNTISTSVRASGPDGRGFEVFPAYAWTWADDPTFLRQAAAQKAQFGTHPCDIMPPMSAADYLKRNLAKIRPNATLVAIEPAPKLMETLQDQARKGEQSAAQYHLQQHIRPDAAKAHLKYTLDGRAVEEWIFAVTVTTATTGPSYNARTMQMTQSNSYSSQGNMVAERAPAGQLESSQKFFELVNSTYHIDRAWQGRVTQNALAVQQVELKGVRDRSAIVAKNADDIRNIQREGYENRQKVQDQAQADFSQVIRGVESYQNPNTGEKVELDANYGHAWVNGNGTYLLTDQVNFDPNTVSTQSWTPLNHVKADP